MWPYVILRAKPKLNNVSGEYIAKSQKVVNPKPHKLEWDIGYNIFWVILINQGSIISC